MIERSVIRAEGANSAAILDWISDHGGVGATPTAAPARSRGLRLRRPACTGGAGTEIRNTGKRVSGRAR